MEFARANVDHPQKLHHWGHANKGGSLDKCSIYDLDYTNFDAMKEANNGSQLTNQTRYCKSWIFAENETQTLITEVSLKCITGSQNIWFLESS